VSSYLNAVPVSSSRDAVFRIIAMLWPDNPAFLGIFLLSTTSKSTVDHPSPFQRDPEIVSSGVKRSGPEAIVM
jgi:hypothetical protein